MLVFLFLPSWLLIGWVVAKALVGVPDSLVEDREVAELDAWWELEWTGADR